MKRIILFPLAALLIVFVSSCMKKAEPCSNYSITQDRSIIDSFLDVNTSLNVSFNTTHSVYFGIESPGSGSQPAGDSLIVFKRETKLLNGTLVDSATISTNPNTRNPLKLNDFNSESLDYEMFSQLREGGIANIILPSSRNGLGCLSGRGSVATIPPNSQLITRVTLIDVKSSQ